MYIYVGVSTVEFPRTITISDVYPIGNLPLTAIVY